MKNKNFQLRISDAEKKQMEERAENLGLSLAAYIRFLGKLEIEAAIRNNPRSKDKGEGK
jgi:hypothetical protein